MSRKPPATFHYSLIQGLFWVLYCALVCFSSVYLLERGFSNSQIGLLISVSSILSAVLQPVAAARADRLVKIALRQVCAGVAALMALCALGLLLLPGKLLQAGLYMLLLILLQLLTPFLYSLAMDCLNNHIPLNYGLARGAGGATYGLASALCGVLTFLIRRFGAYPEGVSFAILMMNVPVWYSDRVFRPRAYGTSRFKKKEGKA